MVLEDDTQPKQIEEKVSELTLEKWRLQHEIMKHREAESDLMDKVNNINSILNKIQSKIYGTEYDAI